MADPMDLDTPDEDQGERFQEQHHPARPASSGVSRRRQVCNGGRQELSGRIHAAHAQSAHFTQSTPSHSAREMTPDEALQAYLIHQQLLAGIAPENVIPMRGQRRGQSVVARTNQPTLLRINNEGIFVPSNVPPARFTGVIRPPPVNMLCSARFPGFYNDQAPSINRTARAATPPAPAQPPQISRTLPQVPSHKSAQPAQPLNAFLSTQPNWDSRIPRIAEFHHSSPTRSNPATSQQQVRVALPSLNEFLQGVPPPPPKISQSAASPIEICESEALSVSTTPAVNQELVLSSPNREFGAVDTESELSSPPDTMSTEVGSSDNIEIHVVPDFNLLQAFLGDTKVAMALTDHLDVKDIINLMVTYKSFHDFVKAHESAIATRKAYNEALQAARACPPVCYPSLCVPSTEEPSLRWLAMVTYREHAAEEIVRTMCEAGYELPWECADTLKKYWFLFDIPDNKRRMWTVQNVNVWPDLSIYYFMLFYIKVDEYVVTKFDNQTGGLRRLAMAQPSLSFWLKVLKNRRFDTQLDILQTFVRWQYQPQPHECGGIVFGVDPDEVGLLQYENYGRRGERTVKFERPDTYVMKELIRRNISMQQMYIDVHNGEGDRYNNVTVQNSTWDYEVRRHAADDDAPDWVKALQMRLEA
ncbi:hypothetical protein BJX96DRAFT_183221 [Aspergillus floccosus]